MVAKKTASKSDKALTKTGFIRSLSPDVPADDVMAKAKEVGLELTKKLIWTTQSEMRGATKGAGKKVSKAKKGKKSSTARAAKPGATRAAAKPARKKPGPKKGFRKAAAKTTATREKATAGSAGEQKLKALVIELGTARADEVYRSVRAQLSALLG